MFCTKCGKENKDGKKFCVNCGAPLNSGVNTETQSSKMEQAPRSNNSKVQGPSINSVTNSRSGNSKPASSKSSSTKLIVLIIIIAALAAAAAAFFLFGGKDLIADALSNSKTELSREVEDDEEEVEDSIKEDLEKEEAKTEEDLAETVLAPDVTGMSEEDAIAAIEKCTLTYKVVYKESDSVSSGFVISQSPLGEKELPKSECITIYVSKSAATPTPTAAPTQEAAQTATPTPAQTATPTPVPAQTEITLYCIASDFVTLRSSASRSSSALARITTGETMTYVSTVGEFYQVKYRGQTGYVLAAYVSQDKNAPLNYGTN